MADIIMHPALSETAADEATADEATRLANAIETIVIGRQPAAVMLALGMVLAHGIAQTNRDIDKSMNLIRRIVEGEITRQFPT